MDSIEETKLRQKYLLEKYLGDDSSIKKKSKKSSKSSGSGKKENESGVKVRKRRAMIVDEDMDEVWIKNIDEEDEDLPMAKPDPMANQKKENPFKSKREAGWQVIRGEDPNEVDPQMDLNDQESSEEDEAIKMSSGARAGLQTGNQVQADIQRQQIQIKKQLMKLNPDQMGKGAETIYRDSKGRRIDVAAESARIQSKKDEADEMEQARKIRNMGQAQIQEIMRKREEFQREKEMPFARYADDEEYNQSLKDRMDVNDPAAKFLTKKKARSRYPQYQGPSAPPNRYQLQPGYRWDGRDRSNGFEKQLFNKINQSKFKKQEAYAWSTEDM